MAVRPRRPKQRVKPGPKLSHDAHDKLMACLVWWIGRDKKHADYVRAPHYFDALWQWHQRLTLDGEELVGTVLEIYNTPR